MPLNPDYSALPESDFKRVVDPYVDEMAVRDVEIHYSDDPKVATRASMGLGKLLRLGYKPEEVLEMLGFEEGSDEV